MNLTKKEKTSIESVLSKKDQLEKSGSAIAILDFDDLNKILTPDELQIAKKIRGVNPMDYGFKGPFLDLFPVPEDLVKIENQKYGYSEEENIIPIQFIPKEAYRAYANMNNKMREEINKTVLIDSGYRSPACQLLIFLYYLKQHDWDFSVTAKRVALPGYSEHGYPPKQALDFITIDGIPDDENPQKFADTNEYKWLIKSANGFKFYLSYPQNNRLGVIFEPWHWSFQAS